MYLNWASQQTGGGVGNDDIKIVVCRDCSFAMAAEEVNKDIQSMLVTLSNI